jgi:hypothetical protein
VDGTPEIMVKLTTAVGNGQFCGSIENNSWLTFVASATTATLNVNSSNCAVSTTGIQARVYATNNCSTFSPLSNCVSQGGAGQWWCIWCIYVNS